MPSSTVETSDQIQSLFGRIAPHYDTLNQTLSLGLHQVWKSMTVAWTDPPRGGTVLDVCCGTGDLALHLARWVGRKGTVVGLDFSEPLLTIARRRSQRILPGHTFCWQEGDALELPFPEDRFDAITMGYGLRNVTDISRCLSELFRVLRPGAKAALLDFHTPEAPGVRAFQDIYLSRIVVPLAASLGLESDYAYIQASLQHFPSGADQLQIAKTVGWGQGRFYPLMGGIMGVLVLQKPS